MNKIEIIQIKNKINQILDSAGITSIKAVMGQNSVGFYRTEDPLKRINKNTALKYLTCLMRRYPKVRETLVEVKGLLK